MTCCAALRLQVKLPYTDAAVKAALTQGVASDDSSDHNDDEDEGDDDDNDDSDGESGSDGSRGSSGRDGRRRQRGRRGVMPLLRSSALNAFKAGSTVAWARDDDDLERSKLFLRGLRDASRRAELSEQVR